MNMAAITFNVPILAGKTEAWKQAVAEMKGARNADYQESRKRMGITREVVSLQQTPQGDSVVVFLEGEEPGSVVAKYLSSSAPFDRWFTDTVLKGVHGVSTAPPSNEMFVDWKA
jgi:hypothetical protein